jgi:hypothetical protein
MGLFQVRPNDFKAHDIESKSRIRMKSIALLLRGAVVRRRILVLLLRRGIAGRAA